MPQLEERLAAERIRRAWPEVVGAAAGRRSVPQALVNGALVVHVDNSPWLQELTLRADELAARLARRFPGVRSIRFALGASQTAPAPEAARRRPPRPLAPEEARAIEAAVAVIHDAELSAAARRLLVKSRQLPVE